MLGVSTITVTRPVKLRGGRAVAAGEYVAQAADGGFTVAHPSGIAGALAFVPASHVAGGLVPVAFEVERGRRGW